MDGDDVVTLLGRNEACRGLAQDDLQAVARAGAVRTAREGDDLVREGDSGSSMLLLLEGQVRVLRRDESGTREVATVGAGTLLGEMALLDSIPRTATLRAATPVRYFEVRRDALDGLVESDGRAAARLVLALARSLARRQRETNERLLQLLLEAPRKGAGSDSEARLRDLVVEIDF